MNILKLQKRLIQAYRKIYWHQLQIQHRNGSLNELDEQKKLEKLDKVIQEVKQDRDLEGLRQDLHRCEGYFYLHPEARRLDIKQYTRKKIV
ncbi:MAG TPA: hypothetical protein DCS93_40590 [Microscillaceae bacterium]|nr:hypothetical protein [Microscillaceae bacterium]